MIYVGAQSSGVSTPRPCGTGCTARSYSPRGSRAPVRSDPPGRGPMEPQSIALKIALSTSYSPIIVTNTRFRRRPSDSRPAIPPGLKDALPGAKDFGEPQSNRRGGHWSRPPPRLRLAAHDAQREAEEASSFPRRRRCSLVPLGMNLARPVVPILAGGRMRRQPLQPLLVIGGEGPVRRR